MLGAVLMMVLAGPPELEAEREGDPDPAAPETVSVPPPRDEPSAEPGDPPTEPDAKLEATSEDPATSDSLLTGNRAPQAPLLRRCLPGAEPCYRTHAARLLLTGVGALATGTSLALVFALGDRNGVGDPAMAVASAGLIAGTTVILGGFAALVHGDGPTLDDRITPATFGLSLGLGGTGVTDERAPYSLAGSFAPTLDFPRERGRLRLVGSFGGDLGSQLERDPRSQLEADNGAGGTFPTAYETGSSWRFDLGLDLAVRLPYPLVRRPVYWGQLEFRYKPLFFFARDRLSLEGGTGAGEERISQRVALTPLNFGLRWHISPRQRFTVYLGPRWDMVGYGTPEDLAPGRPSLGPIYGEAWFDLDLPMRSPSRARQRGKRSQVVGQLTLGYVHSRFDGLGINFGPVIGFLGYAVGQFAVRVRPLGSPVAYQFELGARAGSGLHPFARVGIVLPGVLPSGRPGDGK